MKPALTLVDQTLGDPNIWLAPVHDHVHCEKKEVSSCPRAFRKSLRRTFRRRHSDKLIFKAVTVLFCLFADEIKTRIFKFELECKMNAEGATGV